MSDEMVIHHCAPTMANIKTANLFSCEFSSYQDMIDNVRKLNLRMKNKGLRVLSLNYENGRGLIYVYRPERLSKDLKNCLACRLLISCGYPNSDENECLRRLIRRLRNESDFPHEIGLFLGYPPEDVDGFINRKNEYKVIGFWKVYGDVETAQKTFTRYRKCTNIYSKLWEEGKSIENLIV